MQSREKNHQVLWSDSSLLALVCKINNCSCTVLQLHGMGLVVVRESKVVGLHCSGAELHAGQAAIIQHGARLADCQLYFSRRPCATCLKMIINGEWRRRHDAGMSRWH